MIGQEGPFTVEERREDRTRFKWIYNLRDENGNIRTNVLEECLKPHGDGTGSYARVRRCT